MDTLGLSKAEIDELFKNNEQNERAEIDDLFKNDRQKERAEIKRVNAEAKRNKAEEKRQQRLQKAIKAEADELIKKQQEEEARVMKREAEEKQTIINLQICKKYTDGATIKSLKDEYNVTRAYLNRIFKKYIRS